MTFQRPDVLLVAPLAGLLVLAAIWAHWRRASRLARAYGGPVAALRLTGRRLERFPSFRLLTLLSGTAVLVLAAAGPQMEAPPPPPPTTPVDLIIAVDVSLSMSGADVAPSRIARARAVVERILEERVADRVALTLFADWPYGLVPLTHDANVVRFFTPAVAPERVAPRDQGTGIASVVSQAAATWRDRARDGSVPVLLLVTDGEVHGGGSAVLDSISALATTGMRVWTAGVGSAGGAPLYLPGSDGAPLLDASGRPVVAGYDPDLLRDIAARGGGGFHDVGDDDGVSRLVHELDAIGGPIAPTVETPLDPTAWLVVLGLLLLLLDAGLDTGALRPPRLRATRSGHHLGRTPAPSAHSGRSRTAAGFTRPRISS